MAALRCLVPSASMRPFISLSCSRDDDRLKGSASVSCSERVDETGYFYYGTDQKIRAGFDHLARATLATVDSDGSFESRLQWPSRSSFCSREDHRLERTRQVRALIVPQEEGFPLSFSRFVRAGALVDWPVSSIGTEN